MQQEKCKKLYQMAVDDLTGNLLPWWMQYSVDEENGGFYGAVTNDNVPEAGHSKFITLNARLIWTFASAYRILGDENYLRYAKRAYDYFLAHFYDREHGGWYSRVDEKGAVLDDNKYIYGNAFAIYGLSEYCRATGDQEALRLAVETRDCLEKYVYDPEYKGFYESCRADWTVNPWGKGMNRSPFDVKTMNTHLHLLEAYTALCRVDDSAKTRNSLRQQLYVMLNKIVDHDIHHYFYFQDRAWKPTTPEISFGHDIEGSWLMMETAEVLGDKAAGEKAAPRCLAMAKACLEQAILPDGSMLYEYNPVTRHLNTNRSWWVQAETVVGFLNAWQMSGEGAFLDASLNCFEYIDRFVVDHEYGEWFTMLGNSGEVLSGYESKIDGWKCPYHNARMCFEILERYEK